MLPPWKSVAALTLVSVGGCCDSSKLVVSTVDGGATTGGPAGSGSTSIGSSGSSSGGSSTGASSSGGSTSGSTSSGSSVACGGSTGASVCLGTPTFGTAANYAVGTQPTWIAVGDLNCDGWPDLVVGNDLDGTVSVLLNNGAGTFSPQVAYPVGTNPNGGLVIDVNGDGLPDVVVANQDEDLIGSVSVLLNLGGGRLAAAVATTACQAPIGVAAGDLDGDGRPDLVVGCSGFNTSAGTGVDGGVLVLINEGSGTFGQGVVYVSAPEPAFPAVGDVNGDGLPDVVINHEIDAFPDGGGGVGVLLNLGNGALGPESIYLAGVWPHSTAVADLNGDGLPDLAVGSSWGLAGPAVSVLLNLGGGTFGAPVAYPAGSEPIAPVAAALAGSAPLDLIFPNANDGTLGVLVNAGDGTFGPQTAYPVGAGTQSIPISVVVADFNGDGIPDLAVAVNQDNQVSVLFGQCP